MSADEERSRTTLLFSTTGEMLLHKWACRDAERLWLIEERLRWLEQPWWKRLGRTPPPLYVDEATP